VRPGDADARPWGGYIVLSDEHDHKVKRITVRPGRRTSYQRHLRRAEHWFFLRGRGIATVEEERREVGAGATVDVGVGCLHRVENLGSDDLVFVEVQHGEYFGEDDIIRVADDYGREGG
jgi:mannose-6-phosphate isomerase-like protein (cupin superfamily)